MGKLARKGREEGMEKQRERDENVFILWIPSLGRNGVLLEYTKGGVWADKGSFHGVSACLSWYLLARDLGVYHGKAGGRARRWSQGVEPVMGNPPAPVSPQGLPTSGCSNSNRTDG